MTNLGPFQIFEPVAQGAMAEVWRGAHRATGHPVAFKIMKALDARPEAMAFFRGLFGQEIRAVSRLDHPGIVRVYEHAALPEALDKLPQGSPYAVMEWLGGGSLRDLQGDLGWPQIKAHLLSLLDALGHAHARRVLHRDLKPGNVLIGDRGPVLTDFGVAVDMETGGLANAAVMGTPGYMAPEQVLGQWQRQGPWTDLYAVGCLGWSLATGTSPFGGRKADATLRAQVREAPPAFEPVVAVPDGFEAWLRRMLVKPISDRLRFAAQAAQSLAAVDGAVALQLTDWPPQEAESTLVDGQPPEMTPSPGRPTTSTPAPLPPAIDLPHDWRGAEPNPAPALANVGTSLLGIRDAGLVGREAQRDEAWALLGQVADGDGPRLLLVEGPSGKGKRSFARWLSRRAHELGVARRIRITHAAQRTPRCGLAAYFGRALHCEGLDATDRVIQIAEALEASPLDDLPQALSAALDQREGGGAGGLRFESDRESHVAFLDGLTQLAGHDLAVVTLTGLHWAPETVAFLEHTLASPHSRPLLFVGLIEGSGRSAAAPGLARLRAHPRTRHLRLEALSEEAVRGLLESMLPGDAEAVASIAARSAGDAQTAEAEARAMLRRGRMPSRAVDVYSTWLAQLDEILPADHPASPTYEVAGVLGDEVDDALWRATVARAGWRIDRAMQERLANAALILDDEAQMWRFVLPHIAAALRERARAAGRWQAIHRALAAELDQRPDVPAEQAAASFAHAGLFDEALTRYEAALRYRLERSAYEAAAELLIAQARLLRRAGRRPPTPVWSQLRARWSQVCLAHGRLPAAERWASRAVEHARAVGDDTHLIEALLCLGDAVAQHQGVTSAWAHYWEAHRLCRTRPVGGLTLRALTRAGWAQARMGHMDEADALLTRGLAMAQPRSRGRADVYLALAMTAWQRGASDAAGRHARAAIDLFDTLGLRGPKARAMEVFADAARHRGEFEAAEAAQRDVLALMIRTGDEHRYVAEGNLGLCLLAAGREDDAFPLLSESVAQANARGHLDISAIMGLHLALIEARRGDWLPAVAVFTPPAPLTVGAVTSADAALGALTLARLAEASGQASIADAAWAVALDQFSRLGRADEYGDIAVEQALAQAQRPPA